MRELKEGLKGDLPQLTPTAHKTDRSKDGLLCTITSYTVNICLFADLFSHEISVERAITKRGSVWESNENFSNFTRSAFALAPVSVLSYKEKERK